MLIHYTLYTISYTTHYTLYTMLIHYTLYTMLIHYTLYTMLILYPINHSTHLPLPPPLRRHPIRHCLQGSFELFPEDRPQNPTGSRAGGTRPGEEEGGAGAARRRAGGQTAAGDVDRGAAGWGRRRPNRSWGCLEMPRLGGALGHTRRAVFDSACPEEQTESKRGTDGQEGVPSRLGLRWHRRLAIG